MRGPILAMALLTTVGSSSAVAGPAGEPAPPPSPSSPVNAAPTPGGAPAAAPAPRASSGAKFGVLGIGPASLPANLAAALEAAAAAGLAASGGDVVARALTVRAAGSCDTPACLRGIAGASGARYLLRGTCAIEGSNYRVRLELVDSESGTVAAAREDPCEICTEHDVVEATNIAASALKATLDRTADRTARSSAPGHPAPGADLSKGHLASGTGAAPRPQWLRVAPWVAFVAAAAAIGAGAYYLYLSDRGTDDDQRAQMPTKFYDNTSLEGGLLIGAGVVAAALGVVALTWTPSVGGAAAPASGTSSSSESASASVRPAGVSLSPAGVAAWTRF